MKRKIIVKLNSWKDKKDRKPLILKGARQVGKTYILSEFAKTAFPSYHYLNFERDAQLQKIFEPDLKPERILQEISFYLNKNINIGQDLLIFDEIQASPRALTSLKYFSEQMPELHLCAAGSLLGIGLSEESFPVGKVEFFNLYPLSFEEFLIALNETKSLEYLHSLKEGDSLPEVVHDHLWQQLKSYWVVGGLPEVVQAFIEEKGDLFKGMSRARKKQEDLVTAYLADIAKHSGKQNSMHLERLLRNIPEQLARAHDQSAPKFKFKSVIPNLKGYLRLAGAIDWLETAGLILKVKIVNSAKLPLSAYSKESIFKLFLFDVGLLGALSGLSPKSILDSDYGSYKGYFAENFVAQEFLSSGATELYCWHERTSEVEFVREIEGQLIPIEVKSGWMTQTKSIKVFAQKYHPPLIVIFSARNLSFDQEKRLHRYPLYLAGFFPLPFKTHQLIDRE